MRRKEDDALTMQIPEGARFVLDRLTRAGYEAYLVGGCVRDMIMQTEPKDYDICTSALPEQMQEVFADCHVVETGLKHGTLTVVVDHEPYEATTFRVDGEYTDSRHPDSVSFVADVTEDLARRDFTVNAMAWHPDTGLIDPFGGREDIQRRMIRCVGDAETRFGEDALRIMRALRFASSKQFAIEEKTAAAVHELRHTLVNVAAERIRVELAKLLCGAGCGDILRDYHDVLTVFIPELAVMKDFDQRNPHHLYDLWEHTVRAVEHAPATEAARLAMLLHDTGKPDCFTPDENGVGHMPGHAKRSREIAEDVCARLKTDRATADQAAVLVEYHDIELSDDPRIIRRRLNKFGEENLRTLIHLQYADALATGTRTEAQCAERRDTLLAALESVLAQSPCFTLRDLSVNGRDMAALGLRGPAIGQMLTRLLEGVMDETLPNDREALISAAKQYAND